MLHQAITFSHYFPSQSPYLLLPTFWRSSQMFFFLKHFLQTSSGDFHSPLNFSQFSSGTLSWLTALFIVYVHALLFLSACQGLEVMDAVFIFLSPASQCLGGWLVQVTIWKMIHEQMCKWKKDGWKNRELLSYLGKSTFFKRSHSLISIACPSTHQNIPTSQTKPTRRSPWFSFIFSKR